jgi:hypothetical protein
MLDGVSILPALDDQPGIAVVNGRAFEAREPDGLSAFHTRDQVGDIGSVDHLVSQGLAHVAERREAGRDCVVGSVPRREAITMRASLARHPCQAQPIINDAGATWRRTELP